MHVGEHYALGIATVSLEAEATDIRTARSGSTPRGSAKSWVFAGNGGFPPL